MSDETPETPPSPAPTPTPGGQATALWKRLGATQRLVVVGVLVAAIAGIGFLVTSDRGPEHAVLFSNLSQEEAGRIVQELQTRKVAYDVTAGGTAITVPEDQVHELRLTMAADGVSPAGGGVGFELFDKQAFGTTSFVERMNFRRALEGELARTIQSLDSVERARVHIAMGKQSLYSKQDDPPTASVVLSIGKGQTLSRAQKRGIVNLVAASVDGLATEHVTLVDGDGNALNAPDTEAIGPEGTMDLERSLAKRVERMLEAFLGPGHVAVTVTADLDRDRIERTEELYDQGPDKIAIRKETRSVQGGVPGADNVAGVAGAQGNLPGNAGGQPAAGGAGSSLQETKDYEVNRIVQRTVGPRVSLRRLHVAVLVDETVDDDGNPVTRTPDELTRIESIAREAAGLDEERGDRIAVQSVPFVRPEPLPEAEEVDAEAEAAPEGLPIWMLAAAGGGALLLFIIFFAVLRRRRRVAPEVPSVTALPMTVGELEAELPTAEAALTAGDAPALDEETATPRERAIAAAQEKPELAAKLLQAWLTESAPSPRDYDEDIDMAS